MISSPSCGQEGCWLTGGAAQFSTITNFHLGQSNRTKNSKEYVLVTRWDDDTWPPQCPILMASARAHILVADGYSVLLRLE